MMKSTLSDKIFYLLYFISVILFIICDIKFLDLPQKIDILVCFGFLFIFNMYFILKKRLKK